MQQNFINPYQQTGCSQMGYPQMSPNAVNINIISPQAYGSSNGATSPMGTNNFYSLYGQNANPNLPIYPCNYNNLALQQNYAYPYPSQQFQTYQQPDILNTHQRLVPDTMSDIKNQNEGNALDSINQTSMTNSTNLIEKTPNPEVVQKPENKSEEKMKKITPLTDDYIKSLENYMNNENPKIRLIGTKELLERFKEDENRKDNPSLMPLLNKALRDSSPSVRFLALTMLQLQYALGNDETVTILKEIQAQNTDKIGEDALLASEILLNMAGAQKVEVPMTQEEIEKATKNQGETK